MLRSGGARLLSLRARGWQHSCWPGSDTSAAWQVNYLSTNSTASPEVADAPDAASVTEAASQITDISRVAELAAIEAAKADCWLPTRMIIDLLVECEASGLVPWYVTPSHGPWRPHRHPPTHTHTRCRTRAGGAPSP